VLPDYERAAKNAGLDPNDPLLAAAFFDSWNQSPKMATAPGGFLDQLPRIAQNGGVTLNNIIEARTQSFKDENGRLDAPGLGNDINRVRADQTRRMNAIAEVLGVDGLDSTGSAPPSNGSGWVQEPADCLSGQNTPDQYRSHNPSTSPLRGFSSGSPSAAPIDQSQSTVADAAQHYAESGASLELESFYKMLMDLLSSATVADEDSEFNEWRKSLSGPEKNLPLSVLKSRFLAMKLAKLAKEKIEASKAAGRTEISEKQALEAAKKELLEKYSVQPATTVARAGGVQVQG
jgi:hypothetical protein